MASAQSLLSSKMLAIVVVTVFGLLPVRTVIAGHTSYPIQWTVPPNFGALSKFTGEALPQITADVTVATIEIGDTLHFQYNNVENNLVEVTESAIKECNSSAPLGEWTDGDTSITFLEKGTFFYICGTPDHCLANQRLTVEVTDRGANKLASYQTALPHQTVARELSEQDDCGDLSNICYNHAPPAFKSSQLWIFSLLALGSILLYTS